MLKSKQNGRGCIHICSNQFNRNDCFDQLYRQHCSKQGLSNSGKCDLDRNKQFVIVGSDEFVDAILDVKALRIKKKTAASSSSSSTSGTPAPTTPASSSTTTASSSTTTKTIAKEDIDKLKKDKQKYIDKLKKRNVSFNTALIEATDKKNTALQNVYAKKIVEINGTLTKLKPDVDATNYETIYKLVHDGAEPVDKRKNTVELATLSGDNLKANQNSIKRNKNVTPDFFPDSYKYRRNAQDLPVAFKLSDFLGVMGPSILQIFAEQVVHAGVPINDLHHQSLPANEFYGGNPLMPVERVRPLTTYPEEELDSLPRFRPLFNTVVVVADADNMAAENPTGMQYLMDLIRHEPTCTAHYFVTEFHSDNVGALTRMCDSLRPPVKQVEAQITELYDIASAAWTPVAVVREGQGQTTVEFKEKLLQTKSNRTFAVVPNLVRQYSQCEALSSPRILKEFLEQNKICVRLHMTPPTLMALEGPKDGNPGTSVASEVTDGNDIDEEDVAAVKCAMKEGRFGDDAHSDAVRLKLKHMADNLKGDKGFGKQLLVCNEPCVNTYAGFLKKNGGSGLKVLDLSKEKSWNQISRYQKPVPTPEDAIEVPKLIVVVRKVAELDRFAAEVQPRVLRRTRVYVVERQVFEQRGVPRMLGVRHVFLMGNDIRLALIASDPTNTGRFAVVTVWKYAVAAAPGPFSRANNLANTSALAFASKNDPAFPKRGLGFSATEKPSHEDFLLQPWLFSGEPTVAQRWKASQRGDIGGARRLSRTMLGIDFLEDIAEEERKSFEDGLFDLHARGGVTMEDIVDQLQNPDVKSFDGQAILRSTREWVNRVKLKPGMHDMVLAAVQAILNGETYRAYAGAARVRRCVGLRKRIAVYAALLHKIRAESVELQEAVRALVRGSGRATGALPMLLAEDAAGKTVNLVMTLDKAALVASARSKHTMLDAYRRSVIVGLRAAWNELKQCPKLPEAGGGDDVPETLVFTTLADHDLKRTVYADALQHAADFQRAHANQVDGGNLTLLLFNSMEGKAMLWGGLGAVLSGVASYGAKSVGRMARRMIEKEVAKRATGYATGYANRYFYGPDSESEAVSQPSQTRPGGTHWEQTGKQPEYAAGVIEGRHGELPIMLAKPQTLEDDRPIQGPAINNQQLRMAGKLYSRHQKDNLVNSNLGSEKAIPMAGPAPTWWDNAKGYFLNSRLGNLAKNVLGKKILTWAMNNVAGLGLGFIGAGLFAWAAVNTIKELMNKGMTKEEAAKIVNKFNTLIKEEKFEEAAKLKEEFGLKYMTKEAIQEFQGMLENEKTSKLKKLRQTTVMSRDYTNLDSDQLLGSMDDTLTDGNESDPETIYLGHGVGRARQLDSLRQLREAAGEKGSEQMEVRKPPEFRMASIAGEVNGLKDFLKHNLEVAAERNNDRSKAYQLHLIRNEQRRLENAKKGTFANKLKKSLWDNKLKLAGATAAAAGAAALAAAPLAAAAAGAAGLGLGAYGLYKYFAKDKGVEASEKKLAALKKEYGSLSGGGEKADIYLATKGQLILEGGAWAAAAPSGRLVTVDTSTVKLSDLVSLSESGMAPVFEVEDVAKDQDESDTVEVVFKKGSQDLFETSSISGAFLRVFVEQSQDCAKVSKEKSTLKYIGDVIGVKGSEIQCAGSSAAAASSNKVEISMLPGTHDMLFLGRGGRSRTLLWNLDPRIRIECSQIVLA